MTHDTTTDMNPRRPYRVKAGLVDLFIRAADREQAEAIARDRLRDELPRLWRMIQSMGDVKFDVREVRSLQAQPPLDNPETQDNEAA